MVVLHRGTLILNAVTAPGITSGATECVSALTTTERTTTMGNPYNGTDRRILNNVTDLALAYLIGQCFTMDGTDPEDEVLDTVHDWLLYDHEGYTRWAVDDAYDLVGHYPTLARLITDNLP